MLITWEIRVANAGLRLFLLSWQYPSSDAINTERPTTSILLFLFGRHSPLASEDG